MLLYMDIIVSSRKCCLTGTQAPDASMYGNRLAELVLQSTCTWMLLRAGFVDQVDVLEYYDTTVRSASSQFYIPAVLRVRMYVSKKEFKAGRLSLSRRNIVLRDKAMCQCVLSFSPNPSFVTLQWELLSRTLCMFWQVRQYPPLHIFCYVYFNELMVVSSDVHSLQVDIWSRGH